MHGDWPAGAYRGRARIIRFLIFEDPSIRTEDFDGQQRSGGKGKTEQHTPETIQPLLLQHTDVFWLEQNRITPAQHALAPGYIG